MEKIEEEFKIQTSSKNTDIEEDTEQIKFLIIKSIYLDSLKLYSCMTWFLAILSQNDSENIKFFITAVKQSESTTISEITSVDIVKNLQTTLLESYFKTFTLDLYYMNNESMSKARQEFLRPDKLIALNVLNKNEEDEFNQLDDLFQVLSKSLGFFFIKNYDLSESLTYILPDNDLESYDLPLIRCFDFC